MMSANKIFVITDNNNNNLSYIVSTSKSSLSLFNE